MSDETAPQPRIKITWLIGTLAAFALFVVIGAYSSRMTWTYTDYDQDRAAQRYAILAKVRHDEQARISTTEWIDQAKGTIRIPIEEAMAKEIDTLKAQPAAIGSAIPVIAPLPASTNAAPAASAPINQPVFNKKNAKPLIIYGGVLINPSTGATNAAPAASGAGPAPATTATTKPNP